ncbi:hypothetical protein GGS21DRAFT_210331 [Xylaria nigripes]|nr:hypothetical protein GGS21DRAFT_210331 [Xylaria nigripes]
MTTTWRRASSRRRNAIIRFFQHTIRSPGIQLIISLLSTITPAASTPVSYFPLNSQLPPVARASKPFSFVFSPLTFSSDYAMSYSLADGSPSWLSLDNASRTLSGIPDDASIPPGQNLVGVDIVLVARDKTGSTAANATLVVSRNPEPIVRTPLENQIERFGVYSAPASILLHPSSEFSFQFDPNTFGIDSVKNVNNRREALREMRKGTDPKKEEDRGVNASGPPLSYYAVSGNNNAPLPSWIAFDARKLAFSGKTPSFESLIQPPQTFDFLLVASDVLGFSSASVEFSIVVGTHELTAKKPLIEVNATRDKEFEYTDLPNILEIDKRPLKNGDISSIMADNLPKWLSFDEESWKLSGKPNAEELSTNVTIVIMDRFSDTLNVTLEIKFMTKVFVSDLPDLSLSEGDDFSFDLKKYLVSPQDTQITARIQSDSSWIKFNGSNQALSGTVPKPLTSVSNIEIAFNATQRRTRDEETKNLRIHVDTPTNMTEIPQPTHSSKPNNKAESWRRDLYWLLIIPALLTAVGISLLLFQIRRRRQQPKKLDFSKVSGPLPGSLVANGAMGASSMVMHGTEPRTSFIRPDTSAPVAPSNVRTMQTAANSSTAADHTMAIRENATAETQIRRLTRLSPAGTDEVSLLSDTSVGEEVHIDDEHLSLKPGPLRSGPYERKVGLEVPTVAEALSIQLTPEFAYTGSQKYDYVSDDEGTSAAGHAEQGKSSWKQGGLTPPEDPKRNSHLSAYTDVTTRTSILASGIAEEATTARASNILARPTVIHIPSRPGEARQVSRRTDDSSTFFGGRSLTKSQRNFRLAKSTEAEPIYSLGEEPRPFAGFTGEDMSRGSDTSWDHLGRNSLGIAYKDLYQTEYSTGEPLTDRQDHGIGVALSGHWDNHHTDEEFISPNRWPMPDVMAMPRHLSTKNKPSAMPKNKGKKKASDTHRPGRGSGSVSSLSQTSTHPGAKARSWREKGLRLSRMREKKADDEFHGMTSRRPSGHNGWPQRRTASRASRVPLADLSNEPSGLKNTLSKRSVKTLRSNKSVRSVWRDGNDDDDDAWEDIVPPESTVGGWDGEESDRSFSVYI